MIQKLRLRRLNSNGDAVKLQSLLGIWSLNGSRDDNRADAYLKHYLHLRGAGVLQTPFLALQDSADVVALIETVRKYVQENIRNHGQTPTLADLSGAIQTQAPTWLRDRSDEAVRSALCLAVRLWLFTSPPLCDASASLGDANSQYILQQLRLPSGHSGSDGRLSRDFSAKSLTRKGGFYLVYTSDMQDHLTFASKNSCGYSISLLH